MDGESAEAESCLHRDEQVPERGTELCRRVLVAVLWIWQRADSASARQCTSVIIIVFVLFQTQA